VFHWTTKHVFWQDYFLHMWPASKAKHFEPIEHKFLIKWFLKWIFCLAAFFFKLSRLRNFCMIWFFIKFIQWKCNFIERGMFLLHKKIEINCSTLCIPFDSLKKKYFKHLIPLVYKSQNDIYIVSKLFLNIFINWRRHHFIYWHTTIHFNYNNVR